MPFSALTSNRCSKSQISKQITEQITAHRNLQVWALQSGWSASFAALNLGEEHDVCDSMTGHEAIEIRTTSKTKTCHRTHAHII